jgi:hypothetical protein
LVLLADGLWFQFKRKPWVLYLMALKSCQGHQAVFLDPVLVAGSETLARWEEALGHIPRAASRRICAMVVDNLPGMRRVARQRGWVLQLCHFHLLLKLYGQRASRPHALRGGPVREEIQQLIRQALSLPDGVPLNKTLQRLRILSKTDCGTARMQMTVRAFLRDLRFYRSPSTRPASNHKHSRINGTTAPGNVPTQSIRIKPGFDSTVGNSLHTHTPNCGLQQQMINRFFLPIPTLHSAFCIFTPPSLFPQSPPVA